MSKAVNPTERRAQGQVSDEFTVKSKGRIFLGRDILDELGIDGYVGTNDLTGTPVTVYAHRHERFFDLGVAGKFMDLPTELQRDGELTIPKTARDYFELEEGDCIHLTIDST